MQLDTNHCVPNVPTEPITYYIFQDEEDSMSIHYSSTKLDRLEPLFHVLQANLIEEGSFGAS